MKIAIDFDGTIVAHEYPEIGRVVPGAIEYIKQFKEAGAEVYLWTMRSGQPLQEAIDFLASHGIIMDAVNENPKQKRWTESPKLYANIYIDDAAFGCPLRENPKMGGRDFVDWGVVGPKVLETLNGR